MMRRNLIKRLSFIFIVLFIFEGCSNFKLPFISKNGGGDTPVTRAFFVRNDVRPLKEMKQVFIRGSLQETVLLVKEAMQAVLDTTNFSRRDSDENTNVIMNVHSYEIKLDSLPLLEEYFFVGKYIIGEKGLVVEGEKPRYLMHVQVKGSNDGFIVKPLAEAHVDWGIYKTTPELGTKTKISESKYEDYGVGTYRFKEKRTYIDRKGKEKEFFVWEEIDINDKPISKGLLEHQLRNKIIELAALSNIRAALVAK